MNHKAFGASFLHWVDFTPSKMLWGQSLKLYFTYYILLTKVIHALWIWFLKIRAYVNLIQKLNASIKFEIMRSRNYNHRFKSVWKYMTIPAALMLMGYPKYRHQHNWVKHFLVEHFYTPVFSQLISSFLTRLKCKSCAQVKIVVKKN